ncbi:hypothetical protein GCM10023143_34040 [Compostibacter hankyongensis]|uniref:High potential iron-sulfur proteins family profile domain-containing protein n=2 Tax=Compostibacter hankyongensis TaxID=1007089 RepID=A0ABP8G9G7_9BACT
MSIGAVFLGGSILLSACGQKKASPDKEKTDKKPAGNSGSCDDLTGVSPEEVKKRQTFGYVKESTVPGSHCGNCGLFIPPAEGASCGGCLLFKGPIDPAGYCTQYAPKT